MNRFTPPTVALAAMVVLSGCVGGAGGLSFTASPATIPESATTDSGFVHANTTDVTVTQPVGVAGISQNVTLRSWVSMYATADPDATEADPDGDVAALMVVSTPDAAVAGQSVNPLSQLSNADLVSWVLSQVNGLLGENSNAQFEDLEVVGTTDREILGSSTEVATFQGTVAADGESTPVRLHVATVSHGDDFVMAVGFHPASMDAGQDIIDLMDDIEHDAD
ncbi:MAG: DUF6517 family protein [Halobacteriota archaeon]